MTVTGFVGRGGRTDLPVATADLRQAGRDLDDWGYCLVADALRPAQLARVRERLVEQAAGEVHAGIAHFDTGAHPSRHEGVGVNQRLQGLINKGVEFQEVALHPGVAVLLEHLLGPRFLLTSFSANITAPGCELQALHTDQGYVTRPFPAYPIVSNVVWMLDDVDDRNGGTRVVPASHLWEQPLEDRDQAEVRTVGAEAPAGTAMVVEGRTYHQAGANRSDHRRRVLLSNYCRAWVRQQENPFLGLAHDVEAALSPALKRLLGYKTWGTLGGVADRSGVDADGYVTRPAHVTTRLRRDGTPAGPQLDALEPRP